MTPQRMRGCKRRGESKSMSEPIVGTSMRRHEEQESKSKREREQESERARERESERAREQEREVL